MQVRVGEEDHGLVLVHRPPRTERIEGAAELVRKDALNRVSLYEWHCLGQLFILDGMIFHSHTQLKLTVKLAVNADVNVVREPAVDSLREDHLIGKVVATRLMSILSCTRAGYIT